MLEPFTTSNKPELILQRLDKIAAELQLLRETIIITQAHSEKLSEQQGDIVQPEMGNLLPDLREFRASLAVGGGLCGAWFCGNERSNDIDLPGQQCFSGLLLP